MNPIQPASLHHCFPVSLRPQLHATSLWQAGGWRCCVLGLVVLWSCLVAACGALLEPSFMPQTPDQQAIARTVETFLMALHQRQAATLRDTLTADATVTSILEGTKLFSKPYQEIEQQYLQESLLAQESRVPLRNFHQTAPDMASIETSLVVSATVELDQTKKVQWQLRRQQDTWRIAAITEASSMRYVHTKAYGAGS